MRISSSQALVVATICLYQGYYAYSTTVTEHNGKGFNGTVAGNEARALAWQYACCGSEATPSESCLPCRPRGEWQARQASLIRNVLTDFSGRNFTFSGDDEDSYNLFTEADHQLNAILSNSKPKARHLGITLRGVGIHGSDTRVKISVSDDEQLEVFINERRFSDNSTRLDGVVVNRGCQLGNYTSSRNQATVTIKDRFLSLVAWVIPADGKESLSLSCSITLTDHPMSQVHGILGQTVEAQDLLEGEQRVSMPSNLQFYGEGQISDYSTTDLFSSDSTFSIFTRKAERRRQKRKRQMLEGNALASMAFAKKAESGVSQNRKFPK